VDLALLEMAANGTALDAGQASLVRRMCSSGARLQLAIAPAGAGKTTAMGALTLAWTDRRLPVSMCVVPNWRWLPGSSRPFGIHRIGEVHAAGSSDGPVLGGSAAE
jgi:AAA domain